MKILKVWFFTCLVFAFTSLYTLVEESYEVVYKKKNETDAVRFLICENLSDLYPNQTEMDLLKVRGDLYDHFNRSFDWRSKDHPNIFEKLVLNRTRSGGYLIAVRMICLIIDDRSDLESIDQFLSDREESLMYFVMKHGTLNFAQVKYRSYGINQLIVLKKSHPYSDCSSSNSRFRCLHECFKRSFRLANYLYLSDEIGKVQLNFSDRNRSIDQSEMKCFGECKREDCKMVQLIPVDQTEEPKTAIFEARSKLSEFDFWPQFIGLLCSFVGLSFNEFVSVAIKFAQSKVRRTKVKIALTYSKFAILFLILASFGYLCVRKTLDAENNLNIKETRNFIKPKVVHLALCLDVYQNYLNGSYGGKTMWEIEKATNRALKNQLKGIYVNYETRSLRTDYVTQDKVLFKNHRRCFILTIEPNYQIILSNPTLKLKFKNHKFHPPPELYLLSENESLNRKSFEYSGKFAFHMRIVKRLKSNGKCVNYEEKWVKCTSRWHCVERCINRRFSEMHQKIIFGSSEDHQVVDKDSFSPDEWIKIRLMENPESNRSIYEEIRTACFQEIPLKDACLEINFEKTVQIDQPNGKNTLEIDLRFDLVQSTEVIPSPYKLLLDLVNIQSFLFGLTFYSTLKMVGSFIQTRLKLRQNMLFLIYLLCSIGATWHTYHILHLVISGELVPTEHYELAKRIEMPVMMFCRQIDKKLIDANHRLTGNYLEKLTRQMTTKSTFENVTYLDELNEWIPFDLNLIERFYLLNMKCFRMKINRRYERNQFHLSPDNQVVRVNFTDKLQKPTFFMTNTEEAAGFSKIAKLFLDKHKYSITQETSIYQYEDRFSFIRRHFSSAQEDDLSDLQTQLEQLQGNEHDLRTLKVSLEENEFDCEVEEDLFEQLFSAQKHLNKRTDLNYQQMFAANHLRK